MTILIVISICLVSMTWAHVHGLALNIVRLGLGHENGTWWDARCKICGDY